MLKTGERQRSVLKWESYLGVSPDGWGRPCWNASNSISCLVLVSRLWSGFLARSTEKGGVSYIILPSASRFEAWIHVGYLHIPWKWMTIASCKREIQNSGAHCPMLMTPVMFPKPNPTPPVSCGDADSIPVSSPHAVQIPRCITQRCVCSVLREKMRFWVWRHRHTWTCLFPVMLQLVWM